MDGARVLYVDDDEALRTLTARVLRRRGFDVTTAASGAEGVALIAAGGFDLVAIDHYMPGQDGLETLRHIQAIDDAPPVVYVTGSDESRIAVAALKAGAADYVVKTVGEDFFDLLVTAFESTLERERLRLGMREAEARLRATNHRLETLLKEVNHRVANSLQMVSAFVLMQSTVIADERAKAALKQTQRRILAIAQVHRKLYASGDGEAVDMLDYLAALLADLEETWSTPEASRRILLDADDIRLPTDKAVAVGVIVNELVSNACKYAYDGAPHGEVRVLLRRDAGAASFTLAVEDDGPGLPPSGGAKGTGLGRQLVRAMASTLKSEIRYNGGPGVRVSLTAGL